MSEHYTITVSGPNVSIVSALTMKTAAGLKAAGVDIKEVRQHGKKVKGIQAALEMMATTKVDIGDDRTVTVEAITIPAGSSEPRSE